MTREELALLLEGEAFLSAAERVRCGENPRTVLSDLRPFTPRYNDHFSREAVAVFQDICAGREQVVGTRDARVRERLEYLRGELRAERISYGELIELQNLVAHIDPGDVELLEAAGVPEFPAAEENRPDAN